MRILLIDNEYTVKYNINETKNMITGGDST